MHFRTKPFHFIVGAILISLIASGCSVTFQTGRRSDIEKIGTLKNKVISESYYRNKRHSRLFK